MKKKTLKYYNGSGSGGCKQYNGGTIFICAYSMQHAAELYGQAFAAGASKTYIRTYFCAARTPSPRLKDTALEVGIWATEGFHDKPQRVI